LSPPPSAVRTSPSQPLGTPTKHFIVPVIQEGFQANTSKANHEFYLSAVSTRSGVPDMSTYLASQTDSDVHPQLALANFASINVGSSSAGSSSSGSVATNTKANPSIQANSTAARANTRTSRARNLSRDNSSSANTTTTVVPNGSFSNSSSSVPNSSFSSATNVAALYGVEDEALMSVDGKYNTYTCILHAYPHIHLCLHSQPIIITLNDL
jgi:hypothetical protein